MATYSGGNHYDNRVVVDYLAKKVDFWPVIPKKGGYYLLNFFFGNLVFVGKWVFLPVMTFDLVGYAVAGFRSWNLSGLALGLCLIAAPLLTLQFAIPKWRDLYYPKYWYNVIRISKKQKWRVTPDQMVDNTVFIPNFNNIGLEYDAYLDFARYLDKVEIREIFAGKTGNWTAIFRFSRPVREGWMDLRFC